MKNNFISRASMLALLVTGASFASAQSSFNFPGPNNHRNLQGTVGNVSLVGGGTVGTAYTIGGTVTFNTLLLTKIEAGDWVADNGIRITNSALPGLFLDVKYGTVQSYTTFSIAAATPRAGSGTMVGATAPSGSTWSVELWNDFDDVTGTDGASAQNLTFVLNGVIPPKHTTSIANGKRFVDFLRDTDNDVVSLGTQATAFVLGNTVKCVGSLAQTDGLSAANTAWVRVYNSAYPFLQFDVIPWQASPFAAGAASVNATFATGSTAGGHLEGLLIPAGSTWSGELFHNAIENDGLPAMTLSTALNLEFYEGAANPVAPAPTSVNLGTLCTNLKSVKMAAMAIGDQTWFKVVLPAVSQSAGTWLDMWTAPSATDVDADQDTEMGLYRADGVRIANDDDDGELFYSAMSFGSDATSRPSVPAGILTAGAAFNGRDALGLAAGTYYVVVGEYNLTFNDSAFSVTDDGGFLGIDVDTRLLLRTNAFPDNAVSGSVTLQDWSIDEAGSVCDWSLLDGGGNSCASGTTTLGAAGAYSFTVGVPNGTYTLVMKGSHWLAGGNESIAFSGGSVTSNFDLVNGDINNDNFVGFDDFDILSAAFGLSLGDPGYQVGADLNGDDFNGFDDFDILSAHFGEAGYGA